VTVEEVYETGEYETVYNLQVADFHTYFVGGDGWAFDVWAHNHYTYKLPENRLRYRFHAAGAMQGLVDTAIQYRLDHPELRGGRNVLDHGYSTREIVALYTERSPRRDCRSLLGPVASPTSLGLCETKVYWSVDYDVERGRIAGYIDKVIEALRR
jgi:hypothetical protein